MVDAAVNKNFIPMKLGPFWSDEMIHTDTARGTGQNCRLSSASLIPSFFVFWLFGLCLFGKGSATLLRVSCRINQNNVSNQTCRVVTSGLIKEIS
jgi:hypothetical protein